MLGVRKNMEKINSFKDLIVWQRSIELVKESYKIVNQLPQKETYALSDQMRRAVISIPSNIAEGRNRQTRKEFAQFLRIASGSLAELETQLIITKDLYNIDVKKAEVLLTETGKMLSSMINKITNPIKASS